MLALGLSGGPEQVSSSLGEESVAEAVDQCRETVRRDPPADADPLEVLLDAGEAARARAEQCEVGPSLKVCRALWLAQRLDPVLIAITADPTQARRADRLLSWAIGEAQAVADPALDTALGEVLIDPDDVDAVIDRARPEVLDPLRAAEQAC